MTDLYKTIIISVVSGVITSALIFVLIQLFQKAFIPWFRQLVYKGVDISGSWYWRSDGDRAKLELKQFADRVSGVYTYAPDVDEEPESSDIKIYSVTGEIKDRFVQLTMNSADPKRLGVLSYVLEVVGDGNEMKGCCTFYATNHHVITSEIESLFRTEALAALNDTVEEDEQGTSKDMEEQKEDNKTIQLTAKAAAD